MKTMSKHYYIEVKFGARWQLVKVETRHTDALQYIKDNAGERYPMRIVRVVRTIVFEGK